MSKRLTKYQQAEVLDTASTNMEKCLATMDTDKPDLVLALNYSNSVVAGLAVALISHLQDHLDE
jgi:hypothetical protein